MTPQTQEMIVLAVLAIIGVVAAEWTGGPRWRKAITAGLLVAILVTGWKLLNGDIRL